MGGAAGRPVEPYTFWELNQYAQGASEAIVGGLAMIFGSKSDTEPTEPAKPRATVDDAFAAFGVSPDARKRKRN